MKILAQMFGRYSAFAQVCSVFEENNVFKSRFKQTFLKNVNFKNELVPLMT